MQGFSSRAADGSEGPLDKPAWPAKSKVRGTCYCTLVDCVSNMLVLPDAESRLQIHDRLLSIACSLSWENALSDRGLCMLNATLSANLSACSTNSSLLR